jgi:hypothetical protein
VQPLLVAAPVEEEVLSAASLSKLPGSMAFIRYGFDTPKLASALFGFVKSYF